MACMHGHNMQVLGVSASRAQVLAMGRDTFERLMGPTMAALAGAPGQSGEPSSDAPACSAGPTPAADPYPTPNLALVAEPDPACRPGPAPAAPERAGPSLPASTAEAAAPATAAWWDGAGLASSDPGKVS